MVTVSFIFDRSIRSNSALVGATDAAVACLRVPCRSSSCWTQAWKEPAKREFCNSGNQHRTFSAARQQAQLAAAQQACKPSWQHVGNQLSPSPASLHACRSFYCLCCWPDIQAHIEARRSAFAEPLTQRIPGLRAALSRPGACCHRAGSLQWAPGMP